MEVSEEVPRQLGLRDVSLQHGQRHGSATQGTNRGTSCQIQKIFKVTGVTKVAESTAYCGFIP